MVSPSISSRWRPSVISLRSVVIGAAANRAPEQASTAPLRLGIVASAGPLRLRIVIVGLGTAGSALARKAKALGMRVLATKRTPTIKPEFVDHLGTSEFLPQLLADSDLSLIHISEPTRP